MVPQIFCNGEQRLACYIQEDAPESAQAYLRGQIENHGGMILTKPDHALMIIIVNRNTKLGTKLICDYSAGENDPMTKGVVNHAWVNDCIDNSIMLGPRSWGGHALRPLSLSNFFQTSSIASPSQRPQSPFPLPRDHTSTPRPGEMRYGSSSADLGPGQPPYSGSSSRITPTNYLHRRTSYPEEAFRVPSSKQTPTLLNRQIATSARRKSSPGPNNAQEPDSPPPAPQAHDVRRGLGYVYTPGDVEYIKAFLPWAFRVYGRNTTLIEACGAIAEKMTWHSAPSIREYLRNHPEIVPDSGSPSQVSANPNSPDEPLPPLLKSSSGPQVNSVRRSSWMSTPSKYRLPPNSTLSYDVNPPPTAPEGIKIGTGGRYRFTPEDEQYAVDYLKWCFENDPNVSRRDLSAGLGETAPHHSTASWDWHIFRHRKYFEACVPQLKSVFPSEPGEGTVKNEKNYETNSSDSDFEDTFTHDGDTGSKDAPHNHSSHAGPRSLPTKFTDEDFENIAQFLSETPGAFKIPKYLPGEQVIPKTQLWDRFARKFPSRSMKSWMELHRRKSDVLEKRAMQIVEERRRLSGAPSSSTQVSDAVDAGEVLSRKRSTDLDYPLSSSGPSKRPKTQILG